MSTYEPDFPIANPIMVDESGVEVETLEDDNQTFEVDAAVQRISTHMEAITLTRLCDPYDDDVPSYFVDLTDDMGIPASKLPKEEGVYRFTIKAEEQYDYDTGFSDYEYSIVSYKKLKLVPDETV